VALAIPVVLFRRRSYKQQEAGVKEALMGKEKNYFDERSFEKKIITFN